MRCVAMVIGIGSLACFVLITGPSQASLYTPEDPLVVLPVGSDGKIQTLNALELSRRLLSYINAPDGTRKNGLGEWPKLTDQVFAELKKDNKVPEPVLQKLLPLKDKEYSPDEFVVELFNRLDPNEIKQYSSIILHNSAKSYDDRFAFLSLVENSKRIRNPTTIDKVALAGYLMRVGKQDQAVVLLTPLTRERQPNYFVYQTLSHFYSESGDGKEAIRYQQEGSFDTEFPSTVKGLADAQRDLWKKLDADYVPLLYRNQLRDTELRKGKTPAELDKVFESEEVLPLFPLPNPKAPQSPVRFVNDAGVYQPGQLAVSERAKIPQDAIAIVQQLLLWFPHDARLYWLMAELFAASKKFSDSAVFFDRCAGSLQFSKRKLMMDHRAAVRAVADQDKSGADVALTQNNSDSTEDTTRVDPPISMKTIGYYFGAIGLVVVFAIIRGISRRSKQKTAT